MSWDSSRFWVGWSKFMGDGMRLRDIIARENGLEIAILLSL